jgi:hypothetical protein
MLFAPDPSDPSLGGFTRAALAPLDPPPGIACRLLQLLHDPRTNPRPRSSCPFLRAWSSLPPKRPTSRTPSNEERQLSSAPSPARQLSEHLRRLTESRGPGKSLVPSTRPRPCFAAHPAKGVPRPQARCLPLPTLGRVRLLFRAGPRHSRFARPAAVASSRDGRAFCATRAPPTSDGHDDLV